MDSVLYRCKQFVWEHVQRIAYKVGNGNSTFYRVDRQNIVDKRDDINFDVRYFECGPDGYTTLEKHQHTHVVIVLRGRGSVLVDRQWHEVQPFDCVVIPGFAVHQLKNRDAIEPFGFMCIVDQKRDSFQLLSRDELTDLLKDVPNLMVPSGYLTEGS
jgi:quercetin dioxygenase-like cupin family protein